MKIKLTLDDLWRQYTLLWLNVRNRAKLAIEY